MTTPQQTEVLRRQARGIPAKRIAEVLGISESRVGNLSVQGRRRLGGLDFRTLWQHAVEVGWIKLTICGLLMAMTCSAQMPPQVSSRALPTTKTNALLLQWTQSASPDIAANRIYYGTNASSYSATNTVTANTMTFLYWIGPRSSRWYFAVTAIDKGGMESPFSNEAHWPPYPPQFLGTATLSWGATLPVTLQSTRDFQSWTDKQSLVASSVTIDCVGTEYFRVQDTFGLSLLPLKLSIAKNYHDPEN